MSDPSEVIIIMARQVSDLKKQLVESQAKVEEAEEQCTAFYVDERAKWEATISQLQGELVEMRTIADQLLYLEKIGGIETPESLQHRRDKLQLIVELPYASKVAERVEKMKAIIDEMDNHVDGYEYIHDMINAIRYPSIDKEADNGTE